MDRHGDKHVMLTSGFVAACGLLFVPFDRDTRMNIGFDIAAGRQRAEFTGAALFEVRGLPADLDAVPALACGRSYPLP